MKPANKIVLGHIKSGSICLLKIIASVICIKNGAAKVKRPKYGFGRSAQKSAQKYSLYDVLLRFIEIPSYEV